MSTTRLMVIGVVRLLHPAHGYLVRQELLTWNVETWANIAPGSIYSALKTSCRNGYLIEVESERNGNRPSRTAYEVTERGEEEFFRLLREHIWAVEVDPTRLMAGLSFMWALPRQEVLDALENRLVQLEAQIRSGESGVALAREDPRVPAHVQEMFLLSNGRFQGELTWTRDAIERIRSGAYLYEGEPRAGEGQAASGQTTNGQAASGQAGEQAAAADTGAIV